jgi:hypothetical protein
MSPKYFFENQHCCLGFMSILNLQKKSKRVFKTAVTDSDIFDSGFSTEETDEFTEEGDMECITQPLEPNDFVLRKLSIKKTVKYVVGTIQEIGPDGFNARFLRKQLTCWAFCLPEIEDTAVEDPTDVVWKLPHPVVSGSGH